MYFFSAAGDHIISVINHHEVTKMPFHDYVPALVVVGLPHSWLTVRQVQYDIALRHPG